MAARITENDQIQFLLSCVRHSNFGQVDFDQVVEECQIISKGAAAKRFSRLLKRYPTGGGGGGGGAKPGTPSPSKTNSKTPKPATGESPNDNEEERDTAGRKSGRSGKGSPAKKKSSATAGGGGGGGAVVGGVAKKTASTAASKGRKNKAVVAFTTAPPVAATAEDPGSGEDGLLLDEITVKTETYEDDPIGGMYDARLDPAGFFESDA